MNGVDDLARPETGKRLLKDFAGVAGLQRDGYLVGQYPAAGDIDSGCLVDLPPGHADIGRIQRPDLVGTADAALCAANRGRPCAGECAD